nr:hypothetical protein [Tanacetum cinerariifolium]
MGKIVKDKEDEKTRV